MYLRKKESVYTTCVLVRSNAHTAQTRHGEYIWVLLLSSPLVRTPRHRDLDGATVLRRLVVVSSDEVVPEALHGKLDAPLL